jgi:hypothetical protein
MIFRLEYASSLRLPHDLGALAHKLASARILIDITLLLFD